MENNTPQIRSYYYLSRVTSSPHEKFTIIPFKGSEVTVGRSLDNSFAIPDVTISRHHAVFNKISDDSWSVTNLSSAGMLLNGSPLPLKEPHPLPINSSVQFSANNPLYVYKFSCKRLSGASKGHKSAKNVARNGFGSEAECSSHTKNSAVPASQSLVEAHDQLELRLRDSRAAYDKLFRDKQSLAQSLEEQKLDLQRQYEQQRLLLQQQMQDEQQQQLQQSQQQRLSQQLQDKIKELQEKLKSDRAELEQQMEQERLRKEELRVEQETICRQLQQEKETLQEALQQERLKLQEQVTKKVQEAEKELQEQLQQVQSRLQLQENLATDMSKELEKKSEAEQRLQGLETERKKLQEELERAQQDGQQVNSLQAALEQMEKEKTRLQQEMEMMEFAVTAEAKKAVFDSVEEAMDSEMQCPICNELFIKAILLNCTHTFCEYCIGCWKKNKRDCPSCRSPITSETRSLAIDNFIDKIVLSLSDDMRKNREKTIKEREEEISRAAAAETAAREAREAARNARGRGRRSGQRRQRQQDRHQGNPAIPSFPPPPRQQDAPPRTAAERQVNHHAAPIVVIGSQSRADNRVAAPTVVIGSQSRADNRVVGAPTVVIGSRASNRVVQQAPSGLLYSTVPEELRVLQMAAPTPDTPYGETLHLQQQLLHSLLLMRRHH